MSDGWLDAVLRLNERILTREARFAEAVAQLVASSAAGEDVTKA